MKGIGFGILVATLLVGLFHIGGADLNENVLAVAVMVLLLSLFSDLKEFNFWGLKGKKHIRDLTKLEGKQAIATDVKTKPETKQIEQAEAVVSDVQLMRPDVGNFLYLFFEIEKLLRVIAIAYGAEQAGQVLKQKQVIEFLKAEGIVTDVGEQQLTAMRTLRDLVVHGRSDEVNQKTVSDGFDLAVHFYQELTNFLNERTPL